VWVKSPRFAVWLSAGTVPAFAGRKGQPPGSAPGQGSRRFSPSVGTSFRALRREVRVEKKDRREEGRP